MALITCPDCGCAEFSRRAERYLVCNGCTAIFRGFERVFLVDDETAGRIQERLDNPRPPNQALIDLMAHRLDAPDGPECACGKPSTHESGWCGECVL